MKPSKRVVRDAIRILGYAVQFNTEIVRASRVLGLLYGDAPDLAIDARHAVDGMAGELGAYRDSCAAAENLLLEGWTP